MKLDKKLKEFEESCLNLASKETEQLKEEIKQEIEEQMKEELDEYTERKKWNFDKTVDKLEKDFIKEVFLYQNECKKEILQAKIEIDDDLKKSVQKKLENFIKTKNYKDFLLNLISNTISKIEGEEKLSIGITSNDYEKYKDIIIEKYKHEVVKIDNDYIGGCTIKTDKVYIDNTLLNSLDEKMLEIKE